MKTMLNIPKTIKVGYQKRSGTYTGKLAYIIYTDEKGKVRKEKSWNSWRDNKIKSNEYDNTPLEGFVLNKGVGGARKSYSWNARNEYIRVYDPRGFEFEISVANLLFILQECNAIKGKGIEGEFVYSWYGTELILLPCNSFEYKESVKFTENKFKKITKKEIVKGYTYQTKDMKEVMYLGKHEWSNIVHLYSNAKCKLEYKGKKHIFLELNNNTKVSNYIIESGFTKLAQIISDEISLDYANNYEILINSIHCMPPTKFKAYKVVVKLNKYSNNYVYFIKKDNIYYPVIIFKNYNYKQYMIKQLNIPIDINTKIIDINHIIDKINQYSTYIIGDATKFNSIKYKNQQYYELISVNDKNQKFKCFN